MINVLEKNKDDPALINRAKTVFDGMAIGAGFEGLLKLIPLVARKMPWKQIAPLIASAGVVSDTRKTEPIKTSRPAEQASFKF